MLKVVITLIPAVVKPLYKPEPNPALDYFKARYKCHTERLQAQLQAQELKLRAQLQKLNDYN